MLLLFVVFVITFATGCVRVTQLKANKGETNRLCNGTAIAPERNQVISSSPEDARGYIFGGSMGSALWSGGFEGPICLSAWMSDDVRYGMKQSRCWSC